MKRFLVLFILLFVSRLIATAQVIENLKNESWVRIMQNDTSVNYFVAKNDFKIYVAAHRKAREQNQEKANPTEADNHPHESHLEDPEEAAIIAFKQWSRSMLPFVGSDGKIMPIEQRLAILNKRR